MVENVVEKCNNNRIKYIDIARGISIILMIIGHVINHGWKRNIIYSFHMPLFVIVSGYFFKENQSFKTFLKKNLVKLELPCILSLVVANIIIMFQHNMSFIDSITNTLKILLFSYSFQGQFLKNISVPSIGALWFIQTLLCSRFIFFMLLKIKKLKENSALLGIASFIITAFGCFLGIKAIWLPFSFDVSLVFIIFMYVGYMLNKYNLLDKILDNTGLILLICIVWLVGTKFCNIELAIRHYPLGILSFITAILGTIFIFKIADIIDKKLKIIGNILAWYGKNSMYILCFHHLEGSVINYNKFIKISHPSLFKLLISSIKIMIPTLCTIIYIKISLFSNFIHKKYIST